MEIAILASITVIDLILLVITGITPVIDREEIQILYACIPIALGTILVLYIYIRSDHCHNHELNRFHDQ